MYKSKRFVAFAVSIVIFTLLLLFTNNTPFDLSTSLVLLTGIYIGAETYKKSENKN